MTFVSRAAIPSCCIVLLMVIAAATARGDAVAPDEIVPTSRERSVAWRYSIDKPAGTWTAPGFDDSGWLTGGAPFGTPDTPGISANTNWSTSDIWLRREINLLAADRVDPARLQLLVFHDEDAEIYFDGVLAARAGGFVTDYQLIEILPEARRLLKTGAKIVVAVHCHQRDGGQGIDVGLIRVSAKLIAERRRNKYRDFAMSNSGNPLAGRALFANEQRLGCTRCHTTDRTAARAAPDLSTIGDKFPRAELINQILNPSATIAVGYETTVITTKSGDAIVGVVKEAADDHLGLMGGDGKLQRIAAGDVVSRRTQNVSLMPEELEAALSAQEFADLIEYLASLRLPALADQGRQGMPSNIPQLDPPVALTPIHRPENRFDHPCWFGQVPGEPDTVLICEHQTGRVWRLAISAGDERKSLWGDFRREIRPRGATGLLGLAFHPNFRQNRKYYIQHQLVIGNRIVARISEKLASPDLTRDSGESSRTIIEFPCSTDVHSGGGIQFGPDGYLYIGMGDTGPQGDPQGHGQDLRTPLGKMLRIDVDHAEDGNAYAIPADNPFRSRDGGARPEIWAYGFREPWRFSFDTLTGDLWVGDVGQDRIEEVDIVRRGENYGWNVYEGFDLFSTRFRREGVNSVPPIFAYNRRLGNSVTGGYVNRRGEAEAPFYGMYVCGDFTSKRVWGLKQTDRKLTAICQLCVSPQEIASFGRDEAGMIYLVGYQGTIYRLDMEKK